MEQGSRARKGKLREPKNFKREYEDAKHVSRDGWYGIHAAAFRMAMISACKMVGFHMTKAKLSVFIEADGFDREDGTPLVKITKGEPQYHEAPARNDNGKMDIRARPMWLPGWQAVVRVRWDLDQFSEQDILNLMARVGSQVGICEGRNDSKQSAGCGWGSFVVESVASAQPKAA